MFEAALAELAEIPPARVAALLQDRSGKGLRALFERAKLPASTFKAVRIALETMHEAGYVGEMGGVARLKRRMIERVLTSCASEERSPESDGLLVLLRRFALEARARRRGYSATNSPPHRSNRPAPGASTKPIATAQVPHVRKWLRRLQAVARDREPRLARAAAAYG